MTKLKQFGIGVVLAASIAASGQVRAQGIPVIDLASLIDQIAQLIEWIEQIESMENQITNQINTISNQGTQIGQLGQQVDAMTGKRALGSLLNSTTYQQARSFLPTNWEQSLNLRSDTSGAGSTLAGEVDSIKLQNQKYARPDLNAPTGATSVARLDTDQTNVAQEQAMAGATYDKTQQRITELQTLVDQINETTDEKSAIDLNTRVAAEEAFLTNELIRALTQAQLSATQQRAILSQQNEDAIKQHYQTFDGNAAISGAATP